MACVMEQPWVVTHDERLEPTEITVEAWVKVPKQLLPTGHGLHYLLAKNGSVTRSGIGFTLNQKGHGADESRAQQGQRVVDRAAGRFL